MCLCVCSMCVSVVAVCLWYVCVCVMCVSVVSVCLYVCGRCVSVVCVCLYVCAVCVSVGREVSLAQQYVLVAVCCFPLFWVAGAGSAVFWILGEFCLWVYIDERVCVGLYR